MVIITLHFHHRCARQCVPNTFPQVQAVQNVNLEGKGLGLAKSTKFGPPVSGLFRTAIYDNFNYS